MDVNIEKLATMSPSEVFETYMVPAIFVPWTDALLDLTQLQANDRLLDVACGTGIVARTAYQRMGDSGRVVGLDFNAGQLEVARNIETAIEWREGNATDLPFSDEEFNVITCQQGLQFFPDREAAVNVPSAGSRWKGSDSGLVPDRNMSRACCNLGCALSPCWGASN